MSDVGSADILPPGATSVDKGYQRRARAPLLVEARRALNHRPAATAAVIVGLVTLLVQGWRLSAAPDVFGDEGAYLLVGINLARGLGMVIHDQVFLWHPPAYFLVEAAYLKFAGISTTDALTALFAVRYLNIFFSAITAAVLFLFGRKLQSYKAGLIIAALFLMDSYVQRINRRGMLETLAMLCVLIGLLLFFTNRPHLAVWQRLGSGIAFGVAVLTKEAMFFELLVVVVYVLWFRRDQFRDVAWVTGIACVMYLTYPLGMVVSGYGNLYWSFKLFEISRLVSPFVGHPGAAPPPGVALPTSSEAHSVGNVWTLLSQYGMSYALIALAIIVTLLMIARFRHLAAARYLLVWATFSYAFGVLLGLVSDQYFYYVLVPCLCIAGYVVAAALETTRGSAAAQTASSAEQIRSVSFWTSEERRLPVRAFAVLVLACLVVITLFNSSLWTSNYVTGSDNAYINALRYVQTHIPPGTTIVTSDDVANQFISPPYIIRLDRDTAQILANNECYFILSSKEAWGGYNAMSTQFYDWVVQNSRLLFVQYDRSYWTVGVYQLTTCADNAAVTRTG